jgi:hypothetical protein
MPVDIKAAIASRPELAAEEFAARRLLDAIGARGKTAQSRFRHMSEMEGVIPEGGTVWQAAAAHLAERSKGSAPIPMSLVAAKFQSLDAAVSFYREQLEPGMARLEVACLAARVEDSSGDKRMSALAMLHPVLPAHLGSWVNPPFCCYKLSNERFVLVSQSAASFVHQIDAQLPEEES